MNLINFAGAEIHDIGWHKTLPHRLCVVALPLRTPLAVEMQSFTRWALWQLASPWLTQASYIINHEPQIKCLGNWFRWGTVKLDEGYRGCGCRSAMETIQRRRLEGSSLCETELPKSEQFPGEDNWNFKMWWWRWSPRGYDWCQVNSAIVLMSLEQCWLVWIRISHPGFQQSSSSYFTVSASIPQLLQPNETIVSWEWLIAGSTLKGHHAAHCAARCRALMAVRLPSFRSGSSFTSVRI